VKPGPAYTCPECGLGATSQASLRGHRLAEHAPAVAAAVAKIDALLADPKTVVVADFNEPAPIQADTPPEAPAYPTRQPAAPTVAAEEGEKMTATTEPPKKVKALKMPKYEPVKGPRICGCARTGSHKATCKLAVKAPAAPRTCACGKTFPTANGLNGHKRACKGAAGVLLTASFAGAPKLQIPAPKPYPPAPPAPDTVDFAALGQEIGALVATKQKAYGDSFGRSGAVLRILYPLGIAPEQFDDALAVVRVVDKLFRIATDRDALGESPWRDVCGYGLLGAARTTGAKTEARG
jgi:hypothetical protein